jgi:exonuclease-1
VYTCARELIFSQPTRKHIESFKKKVISLKSFGIEPVLVFDGAPLPSKLKTETDREE